MNQLFDKREAFSCVRRGKSSGPSKKKGKPAGWFFKAGGEKGIFLREKKKGKKP